MNIIDEKKCPQCNSTNTKTKDIGYNEEIRECNDCHSRYTVKFKQVAYSSKLIANQYQ